MNDAHDDYELLTADEVCAFAKFSKRHLQHLEARNSAPPSMKVGRLRRYPKSLFRQWIVARAAARRPALAAVDTSALFDGA